MGTSDIVAGVILLALSAAFFAATFSFPRLTVALSPTVFPRFVTVGLSLLSLALLLHSLRRRMGRRRTPPVGREQPAAGSPATGLSFALRFLLLAAAGLLYALLLEPAGYLLATPPFLAAAMLLFGERRWPRLALVSILGAAFLYAVFRLLFRVPLPRTPWY